MIYNYGAVCKESYSPIRLCGMFVLAQGVGEFYYLGHFGGGFAESVGQAECRAREGCLVVGAEGLDLGGSFYGVIISKLHSLNFLTAFFEDYKFLVAI